MKKMMNVVLDLPPWSDRHRVLIWEDYTMKKIVMRQMKENQTGTISAVKVGGEMGRRIRDMGLVPGTAIKIQGRAPLYDPVALKVMGFTLTLRNNEADHIEVEVE